MAKTIFAALQEVPSLFLNKIFTHRHANKDEDGFSSLDYAVDTGAADAYEIALPLTLTELFEGMPIYFKALNSCTGPSTLDVDGLDAPIKKNGASELGEADIKADQIVAVAYDGTNYQLLSYIEPKMPEFSAENAAPVTLLSTQTEIISINVGSVKDGDRLIVTSGYDFARPATMGIMAIDLSQKSGTATIAFDNDRTQVGQVVPAWPASAAGSMRLSAVLKVTGDGTLEIKLQGSSSVGDSTLGTGDGQIYAMFLRKQ